MKVAFDTNYVLRHIMQDNAAQAAIVAETLRRETKAGKAVLIPELVLAETVRTLSSYYGLKRDAIASVITALCDDPAFEMENPSRVARALKLFQSGNAHFPDYLITAAADENGAKLATFDKAIGENKHQNEKEIGGVLWICTTPCLTSTISYLLKALLVLPTWPLHKGYYHQYLNF